MLSLIIVGCGERQIGGNEADAGQEGPLQDPEWSECANKGDVETCAQVCDLQGMECIANGCPADPEFCDPEPCDMATQLLGLNEPLICGDPPMGGWVASTCEAPIEWLASNRVRCCCAEPS